MNFPSLRSISFLTGILLIGSTGHAQKYASVVELFCNTGNADALVAINEQTAQSAISNVSEENHVYIQHNVSPNSSGWTDNYVIPESDARFSAYTTAGIISTPTEVSKNGETSTASPWYNSDPLEKEIYYGGAKSMAVHFDSYDAVNSTVTMRYTISTKYTTTPKTVHLFLLEDDIALNITGGVNSGQSITMNNVSRAVRTKVANIYTDTAKFTLPANINLANAKVVGYIQDDITLEILSATRGIQLEPYIYNPGGIFSVVENFVNTGCYGGPPAMNSLSSYAAAADTNGLNQSLIQLHIGQVYGNWSDMYKLPLNGARYDTYSWDMGILAGLAAVSKNGIRNKVQAWNNCKPLDKTQTSFIDVQLASYNNGNLVIDYALSGYLGPHDLVYFYVVESDITVEVTGGEIPGTILNMDNVARVGRFKPTSILADTVLLEIPQDVILSNARVIAYIQNDVTYEITGGNKAMKLDNLSTIGVQEMKTNKAFEVFPNPTDNDINIRLVDFKEAGKLDISIYNLLGERCYYRTLDAVPSVLSITDAGLQAGSYLIQIGGTIQKLEAY